MMVHVLRGFLLGVAATLAIVAILRQPDLLVVEPPHRKNSLDIVSISLSPTSPNNENSKVNILKNDHGIAYQSALSTLGCFITPGCYPRYKCRTGSPKKIRREDKEWEEMAFCSDDLIKKSNVTETGATAKKRQKGKWSLVSSEAKKEAVPTTPVSSSSSPAPCLVYSFGIDQSIEWETKVATIFGCEVHAFDPTTRHPNTSHVTFHRWGLQATGTNMSATHAEEYAALHPQQLLTLPQIVQRLGHDGRTIDLLMLDCEGCEWGVLSQLACGKDDDKNNDGNDSHLVEQLLLEFHFQKPLGLASEQDVLLAAQAIHCLRQEGWGMVTQERSGCGDENAHYVRGILELLPRTRFLMYAAMQRMDNGTTSRLSAHYDAWFHNGTTEWADRKEELKDQIGRIQSKRHFSYDNHEDYVAEEGEEEKDGKEENPETI